MNVRSRLDRLEKLAPALRDGECPACRSGPIPGSGSARSRLADPEVLEKVRQSSPIRQAVLQSIADRIGVAWYRCSKCGCCPDSSLRRVMDNATQEERRALKDTYLAAGIGMETVPGAGARTELVPEKV